MARAASFVPWGTFDRKKARKNGPDGRATEQHARFVRRLFDRTADGAFAFSFRRYRYGRKSDAAYNDKTAVTCRVLRISLGTFVDNVVR